MRFLYLFLLLSSFLNNLFGYMKIYVGYSLEELLVRTVQGVGRPLRMRILQLLETHVTSWDILYSLADLLFFYQNLFARTLLTAENAIHATLKGCLQECSRVLLGQIKRHVESLRAQSLWISSTSLSGASGATSTSLGATGNSSNMALSSANSSSGGQLAGSGHSADLQATLWTRECALQVKALLKSASVALSSLPFGPTANSTSTTGSMEETTGADSPATSGGGEAMSLLSLMSVSSLVGEIVTPCLQACRVAGQTQALATAEMSVFMLNNIATLQVSFCVDSMHI